MANLGVEAFWRRCTWNTNRAAALVRWPDGDSDIGPYCRWIKWKLVGQTKFVPFIYELGLQLVVVGDGLRQVVDAPEKLAKVVDLASNQFVVLQSVFVVDESTKRYAHARTWGQYVTGKFQTSIARAIESADITLAT